MYIIRDVLGPAVIQHTQALAFKNVILKYWPKLTMSDGTVVFQRLYLWRKNQGVLQTPAHLAIYRKLGMKVSTINSQNKKGLDALWIDVSDLGTTSYDMPNHEIAEYIEQFSPQIYSTGADPFNPILAPDPLTDLNPDPYKEGTLLNENGEVIPPLWDKDGWITSYLTYQPLSGLGDPNISDADILTKCSGYNPSEVTFPEVDQLNRVTTIAMLDEEGAVFERETRILQRTIEERTVKILPKYSWEESTTTTSRYLTSAKVEFRFRRVAKAVGPGGTWDDADPLIARVQEVIASLVKEDLPEITNEVERYAIISAYEDRQKGRQPQLSMNRQLFRMYEYYHLDVGDWGYVISEGVQGTYNSADADIAMRTDYLSALSPKKFATVFAGHMKAGYDETPAEWWEIIVVVILVIIIIIIAILVAIFTLGAGSAVSVALFNVSMVLLVGSLVLTGLSMYWANEGKPGAAKIAGNAAEYLGYAAMITGLASAYLSWAANSALEATKQAAHAELVAAQSSGAPTVALQASYDKAALALATNGGSAVNVVVKTLQLAAKLDVIDADVAMYINLAAGSYDSLADGISNFDVAALDFGTVLSTIPDIDEITDIVLTGFTDFASQSTVEIMQQTLNALNVFYNAYLKYIDPTAKDLVSKQDELRAQEKELAVINIDHTEAVWKVYEDKYSSIFEVGDVFEKSYIHLTSGRNKALMCKYYESGY